MRVVREGEDMVLDLVFSVGSAYSQGCSAAEVSETVGAEPRPVETRTTDQ